MSHQETVHDREGWLHAFRECDLRQKRPYLPGGFLGLAIELLRIT